MDMGILLKGILVAGAVIVGIGSTLLFKMPKHNPIEQVAEEIIKEETGVTIDLDPSEK